MSRLMSYSLTTAQYRAKMKRVTRRCGWWFLKGGEVLEAVEKAMGLKRGEKVVRLGPFRVVSARGETLRRMTDEPEYGAQEVILEGFPDMTPAEFVAMFCKHNKCTPDKIINRIEIEYL